MKRIAKIIAIVIGALVLLLIVAAVALVYLIDPNQYKDQITGLVKAQTGRELQINRDISLSFFPWLGVETGGLVLSNAPGFGKEPFARVEQAGVKVKLLPLLSGRVEVDTILLRGLTANLAVDAKGRNNWDDLAGAPAPEQPQPEPEQQGGGLPVTLAIGGIDISRAQVSYVDQGSGMKVAVRNLDLESGPLAAGKPVELRLSFDLESSAIKAPMRVNLAATAAVDLDKQTLDVPNLNLRTDDLVLRGNVTGKQIMEAPQFSGTLELGPFNAKALLAKVMEPIDTADPKALTRVGLRTKFSANTNDLRLQDLALGLDDTKLTGSASILNFAQPAYRFDLAIDQLNLDRYMPPAGAEPAAKTAPAPAAAPVVIPLDTLRALNADGRVRIGQLQAAGLKSSEVLVTLLAKDGLVKLDPTQAKLYGGSYKGATSYDARTDNPLLSINEQLSNIDLGPFLKDAVDFDKFVGRANLSAKFTARGMEPEAIKKSLDGSGGFAVQNGTLKGVDLARMLDEIEAAIKQKTWQRLTNLVPRATDETKFNQLKGSVRAQNGVVSSDDLVLQGPRVTVTGKGTASLPAETIDYRLMVNKVPIVVGGTFAKPTFKPDWNAIVKGEAQQRIEKEKGKLEEKLKEKLDERLKGLLRR